MDLWSAIAHTGTKLSFLITSKSTIAEDFSKGLKIAPKLPEIGE